MARYPNKPYLLIMYANYMVVVKKDGQVGRTQLQLAQKANPGELAANKVCPRHAPATLLTDCVPFFHLLAEKV